MEWKFNDDQPIYIQLLDQLTLRIICGTYKAGDRFPSVRELAAEAGVNPNTMQRAMSELERSGLVISQRTSGRFVTDDQDEIEKARLLLAETLIGEFIQKLAQLNFTTTEIINIIRKRNQDYHE